MPVLVLSSFSLTVCFVSRQIYGDLKQPESDCFQMFNPATASTLEVCGFVCVVRRAGKRGTKHSTLSLSRSCWSALRSLSKRSRFVLFDADGSVEVVGFIPYTPGESAEIAAQPPWEISGVGSLGLGIVADLGASRHPRFGA